MSERSMILVAGAINTDLVATMTVAPQAGETITGTSFSVHAGGKGANQAVAATRAGASVAMLGAVGEDDFGAARLADLERDGIVTRWVQHSETDSSGVALIFVEQCGENRIAYVPGATAAIGAAHCLDALSDIRPAFLLATNELPVESLRALFGDAQRRGVRIILNATPDPLVAKDLLGLVDILILNAGETAQLLQRSGELDSMAAIADLHSRGPAAIILTLGAHGVIGHDGRQAFAHRPPSVEVVDTTGAGDTFCGAFAAELAAGASIVDAALYGVRASALSVTRPGAQASIPTREAVELFLGADPGANGSGE